MDAVPQEMEVVQKKSLSCSGTGSLLVYPAVEERHHYILEKSPCNLVCVTVQDDSRAELKLVLKKVPLASQCYQRSVAVQTMWSYSCNCHPFGSVLIRADAV
jgi:hypothetical protein